MSRLSNSDWQSALSLPAILNQWSIRIDALFASQVIVIQVVALFVNLLFVIQAGNFDVGMIQGTPFAVARGAKSGVSPCACIVHSSIETIHDLPIESLSISQ